MTSRRAAGVRLNSRPGGGYRRSGQIGRHGLSSFRCYFMSGEHIQAVHRYECANGKIRLLHNRVLPRCEVNIVVSARGEEHLNPAPLGADPPRQFNAVEAARHRNI
jgi:hypothetical protein